MICKDESLNVFYLYLKKFIMTQFLFMNMTRIKQNIALRKNYFIINVFSVGQERGYAHEYRANPRQQSRHFETTVAAENFHKECSESTSPGP